MIIINGRRRLAHQVVIYVKNPELVSTWCTEQFGARFSPVDRDDFGWHGVWGCTFNSAGSAGVPSYKFSFDHKQDAVLFALRWS